MDMLNEGAHDLAYSRRCIGTNGVDHSLRERGIESHVAKSFAAFEIVGLSILHRFEAGKCLEVWCHDGG